MVFFFKPNQTKRKVGLKDSFAYSLSPVLDWLQTERDLPWPWVLWFVPESSSSLRGRGAHSHTLLKEVIKQAAPGILDHPSWTTIQRGDGICCTAANPTHFLLLKREKTREQSVTFSNTAISQELFCLKALICSFPLLMSTVLLNSMGYLP